MTLAEMIADAWQQANALPNPTMSRSEFERHCRDWAQIARSLESSAKDTPSDRF